MLLCGCSHIFPPPFYSRLAIRRNSRLQRAVYKFLNCNSHACRVRVTRRVLRLQPSRAARKRRVVRRYRKVLRRERRLAKRIVSGRKKAVAKAARKTRRLLRKQAKVIKLRLRACASGSCRRKIKRELRRVRTERKSLRRILKCRKNSSSKDRRVCAKNELRSLKAFASPLAAVRLPFREERRRIAERRRLAKMHRSASKCSEADFKCTKKFHKKIVSFMHSIRARRHKWARGYKVHRARVRARIRFVCVIVL